MSNRCIGQPIDAIEQFTIWVNCEAVEKLRGSVPYA
jgi:hypothetical protein